DVDAEAGIATGRDDVLRAAERSSQCSRRAEVRAQRVDDVPAHVAATPRARADGDRVQRQRAGGHGDGELYVAAWVAGALGGPHAIGGIEARAAVGDVLV